MPRSNSGIYTLPGGNPVTPGDVIAAAWANTTMDDLADALTYSLSRTGAGGMLAPFRIDDGNVTAPGLAYLTETNTGLYRSGAGSVWMSVLGVNTVQFSTVGMTIPSGKALTVQGTTYLTGTLAVTGATTMASTLVVTGAITATGGVVGNVTGNVTSAGTSNFYDVVITGSLDMTVGSAATITGLSTPVNASDAANKGYVDTQDALRLALTGGTMSGAIAMGTSKITGLGTPTADQDAATKVYVDSVAQGLDVKASCRAATIANITLSGAQTIDGVVIIAGDRVLVKDQSTAANNGIYLCASGAWTRTTDADTWIELTGAFTFIEDGTINDNTGWVCTIAPGGTLGSTAVTFEQFSGAGQVIAGAGLTKTGNTLNVGTASSSRIVVNTDDIDLATTGVGASTYQSVTVDTYGRITGGTNPTTLAGYNISDAYTQTQVNTALALKLNLTGGTMSGAIAMGASKITGMADPTVAQDAATKNYIDTIFGSTTSAAASATAAAASASAASTSASNAATSATASAASATSSALSYTTFNNQYLGSYATNPTVNNTGGPLVAGNLYWNSTSNEMRVYSGSAWVAAYLPASGYLALTGGTMTGAITFAGGQTFPGTGTVTSVAASVPSLFSISGSPITTSGTLAMTYSGTALPVANGGTGQTSYTDGQLLIGNTTGNTLTKTTLTAGSGITITNGSGAITIASSGGASAATPTVLGTVYGKQTASGASPYLTAYGYNAGSSVTSAGGVTAIGFEAASLVVSGSTVGTTAVGYQSLKSATDTNTGFGYQSGFSTTTQYNGTFIGYQAGYSNVANNNTAVGFETFKGGTLSQNVAVGCQALSTGGNNDNVAIGFQALYTEGNTGNGQNVAIGSGASKVSLSSAYNNVCIGYRAAYAQTSGSGNTIIGTSAATNLTTATSVTIVGTSAGSGITTGSGGTYIGASTAASSSSAANEIVLGPGNGPTGKGSNTAFITANGGSTYNGANTTTWATISDRRLKKNIVDNNVGLEKINAIRVRNFEYRNLAEVTELPAHTVIDKQGVQLGVIAQELQAVLPDCVKEESTGVLRVDADNLTWYMINAIKELKAEFDAYKLTHP